MKKPTHLTTYCGLHGSDIAAKTGLSLDQISENIFKAGLWFAGYLFCKEIRFDKAYWRWFKLEWYSHDERFLMECQESYFAPDGYFMYHKISFKETASIPPSLLKKIQSLTGRPRTHGNDARKPLPKRYVYTGPLTNI